MPIVKYPNKKVRVEDNWYLGENNDGNLIFYNVKTDEVVKAIDVITGAEDKKGNSLNNVFLKNAGHAYARALQDRDEWGIDYRPAIAIVYDDYPSDNFFNSAMFQAHQTRGVPGVVAAITNDIDTENRENDVIELANAGWEVASHGRYSVALPPANLTEDASAGDTKIYIGPSVAYALPPLTYWIKDANNQEKVTVTDKGSDGTGGYIIVGNGLTNSYATADNAEVRMTEKGIERELGGAKKDLAKLGITCVSHVYSHGYVGKRRWTQNYFNCGRAGHGKFYDEKVFANEDPYNMARFDIDTSEATDTEIQNWLDSIVSDNCYGIATTHSYDEEQRIANLIDWAQSRGIEIITLNDVGKLPRSEKMSSSRVGHSKSYSLGEYDGNIDEKVELKIDWKEGVAALIEITVTLEQGISVSTQGYYKKIIDLRTYTNPGEIYAQKSYDAIWSPEPNQNKIQIGDFQEDIPNEQLILPIYSNQSRHYSVNVTIYGQDQGLFDRGFSSDISTETFPGYDLPEIPASFKITNLPTSDPANADEIWNDAGTLKISSG